MTREGLKTILNMNTLKKLKALKLHILNTLKVHLMRRTLYTMVGQGLTSMHLCMDLFQRLPLCHLRILLFRAQSSRDLLHRLEALALRASWNLLHRPKVLDLRAWTMKDDRFQDLYGKNLHSHRRPPQVPMPHMCIELLTTQKSTGGTSASRSLRNLSLDRTSRNNVGLSEGTGCRSSG